MSPSVSNADLTRLREEVERIAEVSDLIHLGVMDGHFVPNLTFGLTVIEPLLRDERFRSDCHLMIDDPDRWAPEYARAGASLTADMSDASTIFGVKQPMLGSLLPGKTYLTFSHVIKAQPENMALLDEVLDKRRRGMQGPVRVGKMRPRQTHQVGAPGHQDRIHMIRLVDIADCHGRDVALVADAVGKRCLEHTSVDWTRLDRCLPGRYIDNIDTGIAKGLSDLDCLAAVNACFCNPVRC